MKNIALTNFLTTFGDEAGSNETTASASRLQAALQTFLWAENEGYCMAYNTVHALPSRLAPT
jgi:hypothetical protein